jgi:NACHT domain
MTALTLRDIARVVSLRGTTFIEDNPVVADEGRWALYAGENVVRNSHYPIYLLYLYAECTLKDILAAATSIRKASITEVIYPPSLEDRLIKRNDEIAWALRMTQNRCTTREYLFSCFAESLTNYRQKILALDPEHFVDPHVTRVSPGVQMERRGAFPLLTHFTSSPSPHVGVLLADAGQGKTYLTQRLAYKMIPWGVVPLYVQARQWTRMAPEALPDLWKVIASSFESFESPMPWIVGNEYEFLSVTMKAGLFTLIFDGFDEYTYLNRGRIDAGETLEALVRLATDSESRMLLTARTSFWENDIARDGADLPAHVRYQLLPFDRKHAKTYFDARLVDERKAARSLHLYDSLNASHEDQGTNFVGRGFVLSLLADLVDRTDEQLQLPSTESVTRRVMKALCERERIRQNLPISAEHQLQALGTFAEQTAAGAAPTTDLLAAAIAYSVSLEDDLMRELVGDKTRRNVGKLAVHPLVEYRASTREWRIRQEQVYYNLLADQLLSCQSSTDPILRDFVQKILPDPKLRAEIATVVVDQACSVERVSIAREKVQEIIGKVVAHSTDIPTSISMPERDLAAAIAILMVNRYVPAGRPRADRRDELLSYFPGNELRFLQFSGTLASISFKGVIFRQCRFEAVTFVNCEFDQTTIFDRCRFVGGRLENCDGFGKAKFIDGWKDPDAAMLIESQQVQADERPYTLRDLERDIDLLIQKFAPKDGFAMKLLEERFLRRGRFSNSPKREQIITAFFRHVLEYEEPQRKGTLMVQIRPLVKSAVTFYITNGVLTGALAMVFDEVAKELP